MHTFESNASMLSRIFSLSKRVYFSFLFSIYFSLPEPKAHGELIVYRSIRRPSVCASVRKHFQT